MTVQGGSASMTPGESKPATQGEAGGQSTTSETVPPKTPPQDGGDDAELDLASLPPKAQALISKLRKENADRRTKTNNLQTQLEAIQTKVKALASGEDETESPEITIEKLGQATQSLQMHSAVLEMALENGIGKDGLDYFKFLLTQKLGALQEGEELDDEGLKQVVDEVKSKSRSSGSLSATSVTQAGHSPAPGTSSEVTVEQFSKMGMVAKGDLYAKQPKLYESLFLQAKEKGLI